MQMKLEKIHLADRTQRPEQPRKTHSRTNLRIIGVAVAALAGAAILYSAIPYKWIWLESCSGSINSKEEYYEALANTLKKAHQQACSSIGATSVKVNAEIDDLLNKGSYDKIARMIRERIVAPIALDLRYWYLPYAFSDCLTDQGFLKKDVANEARAVDEPLNLANYEDAINQGTSHLQQFCDSSNILSTMLKKFF